MGFLILAGYIAMETGLVVVVSVTLLLTGVLLLAVAARHLRVGAATGRSGSVHYRDEQPFAFWAYTTFVLLGGVAAVGFSSFMLFEELR